MPYPCHPKRLRRLLPSPSLLPSSILRGDSCSTPSTAPSTVNRGALSDIPPMAGRSGHGDERKRIEPPETTGKHESAIFRPRSISAPSTHTHYYNATRTHLGLRKEILARGNSGRHDAYQFPANRNWKFLYGNKAANRGCLLSAVKLALNKKVHHATCCGSKATRQINVMRK